MIFSDPMFFLVFLPLTLIGFAIAGRFGRRATIGLLVVASLIFYAQWQKVYTAILVGSILFNFMVSRLIAASKGRERVQTGWLTFGIVANLACLGYYKYLFPFLKYTTGLGVTHHDFGSIVLPLGISFFTFTQIAYLVDLKQGVAEPESVLSYFFFVTYFPHLIAGPILHHKEIMPQVREERRYGLNSADFALGLTWFTMGMFKKVMIADEISYLVDPTFTNPHAMGAWTSWLSVLAYALQLYFDFSGYSDMALGLARMFSIRFPLNFNSPYKASSIIDFWQRWHMTLTRYIMAYLYSPLLFWISARRQDKGKKVSRKAQATVEGFTQMIAAPTIFTLFVAGVWHGAGFKFLVYGLMHGFYITINHAWRTFLPAEGRARKLVSGPVAVALTFVCALAAFVVFRAASLGDAMGIYAGMLGRHGMGSGWTHNEMAMMVVLFGIVWLVPNTQEILGETQKEDEPNWSAVRVPVWRPNLVWCLGSAVAFIVSAAYSTGASTFLYFQF